MFSDSQTTLPYGGEDEQDIEVQGEVGGVGGAGGAVLQQPPALCVPSAVSFAAHSAVIPWEGSPQSSFSLSSHGPSDLATFNL
jgi:hypothetical protein